MKIMKETSCELNKHNFQRTNTKDGSFDIWSEKLQTSSFSFLNVQNLVNTPSRLCDRTQSTCVTVLSRVDWYKYFCLSRTMMRVTFSARARCAPNVRIRNLRTFVQT